MDKIERIKRAIEFRCPDYIPLELLDVPGIYNAYDTLNPDTVTFIEGAEDFDSVWATYHWTFKYEGENNLGERLRRDEWGCLQKVPNDLGSAYAIIEKPLAGAKDIRRYKFPDPSVTDRFFDNMGRIIKEHYSDRFVCAYRSRSFSYRLQLDGL